MDVTQCVFSENINAEYQRTDTVGKRKIIELVFSVFVFIESVHLKFSEAGRNKRGRELVGRCPF